MKTLQSKEGAIHVSIWCKPSEWDRLQYLSAPSQKHVSTWICDTVYYYTGVVKEKPKVKGESGKIYPMCVPKDKWDKIKERAEQCDLTISKYILAVCLAE